MFTNYRILDIFDYICAQNAQCLTIIAKTNMEMRDWNQCFIRMPISKRVSSTFSNTQNEGSDNYSTIFKKN